MNTYLISYDLIGNERSADYKIVKEYIEEGYKYTKPLESFYFILSNKKASDIRDEFKNITDNNDKIIVINISGDYWATSNISIQSTDWMKKNI